MRAFTITHAQLRTCPRLILLPGHWNEDGTCKCKDHTEVVRERLAATKRELFGERPRPRTEERMDPQMTTEQGEAIGRLVRQYKPTNVVLRYAPFDLPDDYVAFTLMRVTEHLLTGGIDPEGRVST